MVEIRKNIYSFPIVLPENPLKWLNCYVIKGQGNGRNLLIDTGFHRPECVESLLSGMRELNLVPEETDVFLTHLHTDHCGNAEMLQTMGCTLYMGAVDYALSMTKTDGGWPESRHRAADEGMPEDTIRLVFERHPAILYDSEYFDASIVKEHDCLEYGGYRLECISTPGHTPGHFCLYEREHKIMFTGDHVLFDITPNISFWPTMEDALGVYLENLKKISEYDVELALPAHRNTGSVTMRERIGELQRHHENRLRETEYIIERNPGLTGYQIARMMKWRIHCRNWEEFPPAQKWFATCEAISHLEYLTKRNRITRVATDSGAVYYK